MTLMQKLCTSFCARSLFTLWLAGPILSVAAELSHVVSSEKSPAPLIQTASTGQQDLSSKTLPLRVIEQATPGLDDALQIPAPSRTELLSRVQQRLQQDPDDYEAQLLRALVLFQNGQWQSALDDITQLTQRSPQFHLAHLLRADMLAARARVVTQIGDVIQPALERDAQQQLDNLRAEIRYRVQASLNRTGDRVPLQVLSLSPSIKNAIVVDKSSHRLYLFERKDSRSPAHLLRDFYISTGRAIGDKSFEGDLKTPEGVYFITSFIPDAELPEKYGVGAFPTNYPNVLDRRLGKTGDGIWLHGTDRIYYSRPPLDSEGCVVLSNLNLKKIRHLIRPGVTPMIIASRIDWVSEQQWSQTRQEVLSSIESWRQDWESLDVDRYLQHYADNFWSGRYDVTSWRKHKSRVVKQKTYQKIALSDLSLFFYPRTDEKGDSMVLARFHQHYSSNNYQSETSKRLYLGKNQHGWQILYEGR